MRTFITLLPGCQARRRAFAAQSTTGCSSVCVHDKNTYAPAPKALWHSRVPVNHFQVVYYMVAQRTATFESGDSIVMRHAKCQSAPPYRRSEHKSISAHAQSTSRLRLRVAGHYHPTCRQRRPTAFGLDSTSVGSPTQHPHPATDVKSLVLPPSNHCSSASARVPCSPAQAPHPSGSRGQLLPVAAHKPSERPQMPEALPCCKTAERKHNTRSTSEVARCVSAESQ